MSNESNRRYSSRRWRRRIEAVVFHKTSQRKENREMKPICTLALLIAASTMSITTAPVTWIPTLANGGKNDSEN